MLDAKQRERLETLIVEVVLDHRIEYLRKGGKVLTHWDRLSGALQIAASESANPKQFLTRIADHLGIVNPGKGSCRGSVELVHFVTEHSCENEFLALVEESHSYLMSLARLTSEERREAHEQANAHAEV
jgi:hypothetical protein